MLALQQGAEVRADGDVVLWARDLDYLLSTPLLLLALGLLAGAGSDELLFMIVPDVLMIATGYWASDATTATATWVLFSAAACFFVPVLYTVVVLLVRKDFAGVADLRTLYTFLATWTAVTWNGYWIAWLLYNGAHVISLEADVIVRGTAAAPRGLLRAA